MDNKIKEWLKDRLSEERYTHAIGSEETARKLAVRFGVDPDRAGLAALLHDNAKCCSNEELIRIINENNLSIADVEKESPKILHAPVGAFLAQKEFGINDNEILDSIRYHTIGKVDMTILEKIVFLADKIEPYTRNHEFREKILEKLNQTDNLDEALLLCYDATIRSLLDRRLVINLQTIDVWNSLIISLNKSSKS